MSPRPSAHRFLGLDRPVVAVLHLAPLPGAPGFEGSMSQLVARAVRDAKVLAEEGVDAILVENWGDRPYFKESVPAETIAALAVAARAVRDAVPSVPLGVNCLRNDARAALAVAAAVEAAFVRVNVHTGAMLTDQGIVEGRAAETLRVRRALAPAVVIAADILVKHAFPLGPGSIGDAARDAVERGLAGAVIVTGDRTGVEANPADVAAVRAATPDVPILVGSGARPETVEAIFAVADGVIVGTALERGGLTGSPVDRGRVRAFVAAARDARS